MCLLVVLSVCVSSVGEWVVWMSVMSGCECEQLVWVSAVSV